MLASGNSEHAHCFAVQTTLSPLRSLQTVRVEKCGECLSAKSHAPTVLALTRLRALHLRADLWLASRMCESFQVGTTKRFGCGTLGFKSACALYEVTAALCTA